MATINIDTTSQQYQNYLSGFQDLLVFYKPRVRRWLQAGPEAQQAWRDADPILDLLVRILEAGRDKATWQ